MIRRLDRFGRVPHLAGMRIVLVMALALTLSACATPGLQRRAFLSSMIGQPETVAVQAMGVPNRTYETGGVKFLAYDQRQVEAIPTAPYYGGFGWWGPGWGGFYQPSPPLLVERQCETTLQIVNHRVQSWSLRGTLCG